MKYKLIILMLFVSSVSKAQNSAPALETDRPDQTESSNVVPGGTLQIESGFIFESDKNDYVERSSTTYNTTLLRYGLFENLELRLGLDYGGEKISESISAGGSTSRAKGFSPLYAGFKIKVIEEDGFIPEVSFIGGLSMPFTAADEFKTDYTSGQSAFSLSHSISENFSIGYNLGIEWDGETVAPSYFYTLAAGYGIFKNTGIFLESYGSVKAGGDWEHLIDGGITYLLITNLQLDISGGFGLSETAPDNFISFGLSYRLPE